MPSDAEWARPGGARDGTATANAGLESSPSSERGRDGGYIGRDTRWQDYTAPPLLFLSLPSPPPDASERDGRGQARRLAFQTREPLVGPLQSLSRACQHDDRQTKVSDGNLRYFFFFRSTLPQPLLESSRMSDLKGKKWARAVDGGRLPAKARNEAST